MTTRACIVVVLTTLLALGSSTRMMGQTGRLSADRPTMESQPRPSRGRKTAPSRCGRLMSVSATPQCPLSVTVPTPWATPMIRIPSSVSTSPRGRLSGRIRMCNEKVGIKDYDGPFATPTVANGVVYTLSRKGDVFALNARDGKVIWARNIVKEDDVRRRDSAASRVRR